MLAMQYGFDVDDAGPVRQRVNEIGHRFDQLPGLFFKAFLVGDADARHAARYTPFYLWEDMQGMTQFLLSDSFRALVAKYGRPVIARWSQIELVRGQAINQRPLFAVQTLIDIPAGEDLEAWVNRTRDRQQAFTQSGQLHSSYIGLDATAWQLMSMSLWTSLPPDPIEGRVFEVAHLSAPGLAMR